MCSHDQTEHDPITTAAQELWSRRLHMHVPYGGNGSIEALTCKESLLLLPSRWCWQRRAWSVVGRKADIRVAEGIPRLERGEERALRRRADGNIWISSRPPHRIQRFPERSRRHLDGRDGCRRQPLLPRVPCRWEMHQPVHQTLMHRPTRTGRFAPSAIEFTATPSVVQHSSVIGLTSTLHNAALMRSGNGRFRADDLLVG